MELINFTNNQITDDTMTQQMDAGCWGCAVCAVCAACLACIACASCGLCVVPALGTAIFLAEAGAITSSVTSSTTLAATSASVAIAVNA